MFPAQVYSAAAIWTRASLSASLTVSRMRRGDRRQLGAIWSSNLTITRSGVRLTVTGGVVGNVGGAGTMAVAAGGGFVFLMDNVGRSLEFKVVGDCGGGVDAAAA